MEIEEIEQPTPEQYLLEFVMNGYRISEAVAKEIGRMPEEERVTLHENVEQTVLLDEMVNETTQNRLEWVKRISGKSPGLILEHMTEKIEIKSRRQLNRSPHSDKSS